MFSGAKKFKQFLLFCGVAMAIGFPEGVFARQIGGVVVPEAVSIAGHQLVLNGASLRKKFVFDIYVVALFVPEKTQSMVKILDPRDKKPRLISMWFLSEVTAKDLSMLTLEGIKRNFTSQEMVMYRQEMEEIIESIKTYQSKKFVKGDRLDIVVYPQEGLQIKHNKQLICAVKNVKFAYDLLKLWVFNPQTPHIRTDLLGKTSV